MASMLWILRWPMWRRLYLLPSTEKEHLEAMETLRGQRAGRQNGILPEMVKYCADLFKEVWNDPRAVERCSVDTNTKEGRPHAV